MQIESCPFGKYLATLQNTRNMPKWLLAAKAKIVAANLHRIESGETQPSVRLATRLILALEEPVGPSFAALAGQLGLRKTQPDNQPLAISSLSSPDAENCHFGTLLKTARLRHNISQKEIAEKAGYHLRNIHAEKAGYHLRNIHEVESGRRTPGVITALKLVCATQCDLKSFFDCYAETLKR